MKNKKVNKMTVNFKPLTLERWDDFEELFGEHGAYGGCWCMYWRLTRKEFRAGCGEKNKLAMRDLVRSGVVPGLIAYRHGRSIGWISVAPREDFGSLERSYKLKRVDDQSVWSIVCFFAPKHERGHLMKDLINGAVSFAKENGALVIEAYPENQSKAPLAVDLYMGSLTTFLQAGFQEIERRGSQSIVRKNC